MKAADADPLIQAKALKKRFGAKVVMDDLSFDIHAGEVLVILGPSGCGKSTLLRCLIGLEPPDAGHVHVFGTDIYNSSPANLDAVRRRIGMTFQDGALFGSMTLAENVETPVSEFSELPASTRRLLARIKLGMVGLGDAIDQYPSQISGGMRKRAALARAMALDPEVLFFDEPSAGLDPVTSAGLDQLLIRLNHAFQATLVVVTHELESAFAIAHRIFLMDRGSIIASGTPSGLRETKHPAAQRFLRRQAEEPSSGRLMESVLTAALNDLARQ
ncbi:MAG: ABC transporter ATP-binding protein [Gammaproteobacteria bacterium]